jgi:hypothetical protein
MKIIILILSIKLINSISSDGCYGNQKFNCDISLCAKDKFSCNSFLLFKALENIYDTGIKDYKGK